MSPHVFDEIGEITRQSPHHLLADFGRVMSLQPNCAPSNQEQTQ